MALEFPMVNNSLASTKKSTQRAKIWPFQFQLPLNFLEIYHYVLADIIPLILVALLAHFSDPSPLEEGMYKYACHINFKTGTRK